MAGVVLGGPDGSAPILEMLEAAILPAHLAAVDPQRRAGQRPQEGAVVADQHEGGAGGGKLLSSQPMASISRWFVGSSSSISSGASASSRASAARRRSPPEAGHRAGRDRISAPGRHLDAVAFGIARAGAGKIAQRGKRWTGPAPVHIADMDAGGVMTCPASGSTSPAMTFISVDLPEPLRPTSASRSPARSGQIEPVKDRIAAEGQRDIGKLQSGARAMAPQICPRARSTGAPKAPPHRPRGPAPPQQVAAPPRHV